MGSLWLYKHMVQGLILGHINLSFSLFLFLFIINIVSEILKLNNLSTKDKTAESPCLEVTLYTSEHTLFILLLTNSRTTYVYTYLLQCFTGLGQICHVLISLGNVLQSNGLPVCVLERLHLLQMLHMYMQGKGN